MIKICKQCGNEFISDTDRVYCSAKCQHKSMETHPDCHNKKCLFCGKPISYRRASCGRIYCSSECFRKMEKKKKQEAIESAPKVTCIVCGKQLSNLRSFNGKNTCSAVCSRKLYYKNNPDAFTEERKKNCSDNLKKMWEDDEFRASVVNRMITNNPTRDTDVVEKIKETKREHGIDHIFSGIRGGNGKISECELAVYDFLIGLGFVYNKAISTNSIRISNPEKHIAVNYKPDFTHMTKKVCIEIDGYTHKTREGIEKDKKKEWALSCLGYRTFRFTNEEVKSDIESVKRTILCLLEE